ncbi:MAG TPA: TIGR01777 family oxidoreductase [Verrucomicrobiae bacterium]
MRVLVSGASGLVGGALMARLTSQGHRVRMLSRKGSDAASVAWNVQTGELDLKALDEFGKIDAVVHLAGENIAAGRWTLEQKKRIRESRVEATQRLASKLVPRKPRVFISASAVGYYGNRFNEILTERSPGGHGFLGDTCEAWEHAAKPLVLAGVRVVHLRFGMILSKEGGALAKMLPVFRKGLGGRLGSGKQWMSWITLTDALRAIEFCLHNEQASGAYNVVAPNPVTNAEFTRQLASALKRPAFFPVPEFALRLAFGEMADALLLGSQRVLPERLRDLGFEFDHPHLAGAFRGVLYRK